MPLFLFFGVSRVPPASPRPPPLPHPGRIAVRERRTLRAYGRPWNNNNSPIMTGPDGVAARARCTARLGRRPVQRATRTCRCNLRPFLLPPSSPTPLDRPGSCALSRGAEPALSEKNRRVWRMKFARTHGDAIGGDVYGLADGADTMATVSMWNKLRDKHWNLNFRASSLTCRCAVINSDHSEQQESARKQLYFFPIAGPAGYRIS